MSGAYYEEGRYRVRITTWGLTKAKTGTTQFVLRFQTLGMINQTDPEAGLMSCPAFERSIFRAITDKTADWVADDLRRLGYDRDSFMFLEPTAQNAFDFTGIEFDANCAHENYQGAVKERWSFGWAGGGDIEPMDSSELKKLDALFGRSLKNKPKPNGVTQPVSIPEAQKTTPVAIPSDEDIPF